jgi:hypothetical protein
MVKMMERGVVGGRMSDFRGMNEVMRVQMKESIERSAMTCCA